MRFHWTVERNIFVTKSVIGTIESDIRELVDNGVNADDAFEIAVDSWISSELDEQDYIDIPTDVLKKLKNYVRREL